MNGMDLDRLRVEGRLTREAQRVAARDYVRAWRVAHPEKPGEYYREKVARSRVLVPSDAGAGADLLASCLTRLPR